MASTVIVTYDTTTRPCVITLTHKIFFANRNKISDEDFNDAIGDLKKQIKEKWEKPDFKFGCCKVKFKFKYVDEDADDVDKKNLWTKIDDFRDRGGQGERSFQRPKDGPLDLSPGAGLGPKKTVGEWFLPRTHVYDLTKSEEKYRTKNTYTAAHEVGHELGAEDQYDEKDPGKLKDPNNGYTKDGLMYDSIKGNVLQIDIDQIMKANNVKCPPECCS